MPIQAHHLQIDAELFRTLVETMTDAIAVLSPDGIVQYNSPASERLSGFRPSERVGRHALAHVHPDDVPRLAELIARARRERLPIERIEYRLRHADGSWRNVESSGRSLRPSDPDALWVVVSHDVTHRQEANPALVRILGYESIDEVLTLNMATNVWLDASQRVGLLPDPSGELREAEVQWKRKDGAPITVRLRGRAINGDPLMYETFAEDVSQHRILEEQFRQSQKMEAIGRLAGGIAHDFNNLLSSILGYAELLSEQIPSGDPRLDDVKEIRKAGERAAALTRQLLTYSRKQVQHPRQIDLNHMLTGLDSLLRSTAGRRVDVQFHLEDGLPKIAADPTQIEQLVTDLVVNAHDAMPDGGTLVIETARGMLDASSANRQPTVVPGQYVMLVVSDTGKGMDADTKAKLFEPFFTTKNKGRGAGLGLAAVYGSVKQSGGYIWVYSQPGMGTTFKIFLPAATSTEIVVPISTAAVPQDGSETVLLVEDDEPVRELAGRVLRRFGYQVLTAGNAAEAEKVFERHTDQIQLLLTDIIMPQTSGLQLASRLKVLKPSLHVVYMSGFTEDAFANRGPFDPKVTLINKPFTPELLATRVRQALDRG
jgi:PAS domain S-box-containing protein